MAKAKAPFPVRLSDELRAKLDALAKQERRRPSELVRLLIEDAVAAHEAANGPLSPAPPAPPAT
ncbi:ribbon-helix-helix domain-containing protein [Hymenobacter psychrophilus]|uniref:CopG-like RHH_1 or ribbon-helix-helix domain-containing protein, RHH_5 n=1 Tax=Hymenobacter psychrophilus TaxID=651662 RepID=A0A1H3PD39_9BACT|nr:CopG family transcriptional regulator [Hymenobacter psychrophilus]SDY99000.1 CopG-like RHH_1 or ribbon-helix-helix domain-containing protein, RHH_5 [Hymenobacter psychrophilus]